MKTSIKENSGNPLLDYFVGNSGRSIHKWVHYFDIYHRHFQKFRGLPVTVLEIGIQNGGSAHMWKNYFGPESRIVGVDIDPSCRSLEDDGFDVWIGDQSDPNLLNALVQSYPTIDIIIDDGSHMVDHQNASFSALFPHLNDGGVYVCEDTHSSYFPAHGGGLHKKNTFIEVSKNLIDEMHAWYHAPLRDISSAYMAQYLNAICYYDSMVVLEKKRKNPPLILARGFDGHLQNPPAMTHIEMRRFFGVSDQ